MAFIGIAVPKEVGEILEQVAVPGKKEPKDHYHITLLHLGSEIPIENVARAGLAAFVSCAQVSPFSVRVNRIDAFPLGDDGYPIIARIDSPELHNLRSALTQTFDKVGIEYSKKFPEFKPHVTLSYSDTHIRTQSMSPIQWMVSHVVVWGGDKGENRMVVKVPLEAKPRPMTASLRVAARYYAACQGRTCLCEQPCACQK